MSYRNKILLKKTLRVGAIVLAGLVVAGMLLLLYFEPYIIYDREGAHLNYPEEPVTEVTEQAEAAARPVITDPKIVYGGTATVQQSLAELPGYYITTEMLQRPEETLQAVKELEGSCAIMIELKSIYGYFYYSSRLNGASIADVDLDGIGVLLDYLRSGSFYLIAEIPAFADSAYALAHQSYGLPISGGALWIDDRSCYWLDPVNPGVLTYLASIGQELSTMGFREVVFSEFSFPQSDSIVYETEKTPTELLSEAASQLNDALAESGIVVSFLTDDLSFPAEVCTGRLYIPDLSGTQVAQYVQNFSTATNLKELVFLINSKDSRFDGKATMRPLLSE